MEDWAMANEEHLTRLRQGVNTWNHWRAANLDIIPDLSRADLHDVDCPGANLAGANLARANPLRAQLLDVDFSRANLAGAHLFKADLSGADLSRANLAAANLAEANLTEANLTEAEIGWTIFGSVDLRTVRGLDTLEHDGSSTIGIDTLYRSQGNIPEVFLRGAGVPEDFIPYIKSLVGSPFEYYSCFISYNRTDKAFARRLHDQLQGRGIRCWLDEHQMRPGDDIYEEIDRGIRFWDKVLWCCSQASLTSW
jgi:hypothetical protein